jgi:AAA ATPase-like protein
MALLDRARGGESGVLLAEGEPGAGKSMLIAAARDAARAHGFSLAAAAAGELSRFTPLAPLLAALLAAGDGSHDGAVPGAGTSDWSAGKVWARLEELASGGPLLVGIDDLHWGDTATLHALRTLPGLLASYPLCWILARSTQGEGQEAERLFRLLESDGAVRVELRPLARDAQVALMADVLGAEPGKGLADLAACAAGNPLLLTEFLRGLLDEGAITMADGHGGGSARRCRRPSGRHCTGRRGSCCWHGEAPRSPRPITCWPVRARVTRSCWQGWIAPLRTPCAPPRRPPGRWPCAPWNSRRRHIQKDRPARWRRSGH